MKTFRLMNPLGGVLPFTFLPGQFLTLTVLTDGKPVKRLYTIASSPTQHDYVEVTVKHEAGGVVSGYLHDRVKEGDLLDCSGPTGSFVFTGRECKCILLIGGGVGITPMMSVIRYLTDRAWAGDVYLIYGVHAPRTSSSGRRSSTSPAATRTSARSSPCRTPRAPTGRARRDGSRRS